VILETASPADARAMATVHAASFEEPWDAASIAHALASPGAFGLLVRGEAGAVLGFALARAAAGEAELLTLAVEPAARRGGLGRALVSAVAGAAGALGAAALYLEVAEDNPAAFALYRAEGFAEVGRRRGYYRRADGAVDALVLRRDLNSRRP
jgi:[ribosomal protein S18]-alanine N-acetyltransferase